MRLAYVANIRLPTDRAHGIQIMKTCEALAKYGISVELIIPNRRNEIKEDPFSYYEIEKNFVIKKLSCFDFIRHEKLGFLIRYVTFSLTSIKYCLKGDFDSIYSRDELPLWFLSFFEKKFFWEAHNGKWNFLVSCLVKSCSGIVVISNGIKNFLVGKGVDSSKIFVSPDAVELGRFDIEISKDKAREKLGLPKDKKIIMYTGHLYEWKGADVLARSGELFGGDYFFVFVGGTLGHVEDFRNKYLRVNNLIVLGQKPHRDIPTYLKAADVLVIPNSGKEVVSRLYTSPMKLFEYMASGRPIVASNLSSIREVLNESNAVFFEPDDSRGLSVAIKNVLENAKLSDQISRQALIDVAQYSWDNRAKNITSFINDKR
ncbi:MAG: glycosyltransferase family 4 protein [Candidatus Vogelbacteria bacterium]|nr:glycosyltransferase family 4 protein [Candidatus Vogelbacteria bacterium]